MYDSASIIWRVTTILLLRYPTNRYLPSYWIPPSTEIYLIQIERKKPSFCLKSGNDYYPHELRPGGLPYLSFLPARDCFALHRTQLLREEIGWGTRDRNDLEMRGRFPYHVSSNSIRLVLPRLESMIIILVYPRPPRKVQNPKQRRAGLDDYWKHHLLLYVTRPTYLQLKTEPVSYSISVPIWQRASQWSLFVWESTNTITRILICTSRGRIPNSASSPFPNVPRLQESKVSTSPPVIGGDLTPYSVPLRAFPRNGIRELGSK